MESMRPSVKGLELREYLEERDKNASRKRRWQIKTLQGWFGLRGKRLGVKNVSRIENELERAGTGILVKDVFRHWTGYERS